MRKIVSIAAGFTAGVALLLLRRGRASRAIEPERPRQEETTTDEPEAARRTDRFARTKDELYAEARRVDLPGRSK